MILYSEINSLHSHRVRFLLAEKGINYKLIAYTSGNPPEDLMQLNPGNQGPTLVDRDLVLYGQSVLCEYLDERYPHPPLMPVDPVSRAKQRLALFRISEDWDSLALLIENEPEKREKAAKHLAESLVASSEIFSAMPYFLSEEMAMADFILAPLLWRLPSYGIELPDSAVSLNKYCRKMFEIPSFSESLSDEERKLR